MDKQISTIIIFFYSKIYTKWQAVPVIVSFAEISTPIYKIPFPAVTICPQTKAKMSIVNFAENFHILRNTDPPYENLTDDV